MIYEHLASLVSSYEAEDNIMRMLEEGGGRGSTKDRAQLGGNLAAKPNDAMTTCRAIKGYCGIITSLSCGIRCAWRL